MPWTDPIIKPMRIGPGRDAKIEARFSGPDESSARVGGDGRTIMRADSNTTDVRNDWRTPVKVATPVFNEQVARQLGLIAGTRGRPQDGIRRLNVGLYRDGTRLLPIRVRASGRTRQHRRGA